jgi:hypothetical protein
MSYTYKCGGKIKIILFYSILFNLGMAHRKAVPVVGCHPGGAAPTNRVKPVAAHTAAPAGPVLLCTETIAIS